MVSPNDVILHLLHNLGSAREIEQYLRAFTAGGSARRIVVKVGGGILETQFDAVVSSIAFLRRVGLQPIVVHGGGPQLDRALDGAGVTSSRIDGQRVTTPEVLSVARRVFQEEGARLADALEAVGVRSRPVASGLFVASALDAARLGLVGTVDRVHGAMLTAMLEAGQTPIVSPLGETAEGQILNLNADVATRALAVELKPQKIVFLTPTGGLLDRADRIIPAVNLAEDFDRLVSSGTIDGGMALKIREIRALLDTLPESCSVSITSPHHLATELFTHKGNGTLIRRGVPIHCITDVSAIDESRLYDLLETSFGRTLRTGYLQSRRIWKTLLAGDYTGVAVLIETEQAIYLDKFAVTAEAQGAGVGASLWARLVETAPRLFWRVRPDNPIAPWYLARADGMYRTDKWMVLWRGMHDRDAIEHCIRYALASTPSFLAPGEVEVKETSLVG